MKRRTSLNVERALSGHNWLLNDGSIRKLFIYNFIDINSN